MEYTIALDPSLGVSAEDFVKAWNHSPYQADGQATLDQAKGGTFLPPDIAVALIVAGTSFTTQMVITLIKELLEGARPKEAEPQVAKITEKTITTPDGQTIVVIEKVMKQA